MNYFVKIEPYTATRLFLKKDSGKQNGGAVEDRK